MVFALLWFTSPQHNTLQAHSGCFKWQNFVIHFYGWLNSIVCLYAHLCVCVYVCISSVQFNRSVVSHSLRIQEMQYGRPPCPSPTLGTYSNSCPLSRWCHPTTSSSAIPFSYCLQSFPASGSFQMSQFFPSGGQSIGVLASTSVLPMNIRDFL